MRHYGPWISFHFPYFLLLFLGLLQPLCTDAIITKVARPVLDKAQYILRLRLEKLLKIIINDPCDLSRTDEKIFVVGWGLIGL